jgi:uncharacterized phage-associated protein
MRSALENGVAGRNICGNVMFISRHREKLLNAIIFFVQNTKSCNTIKLFKLLNFLDFEHFRQTGESVTGLEYQAWKQGPVPAELWHEIKSPAKDFATKIAVNVVRDDLTDEPQRRDFKPLADFNRKIFTRRELQIMERLVFFFDEATATQMSIYSHSSKMPWKKVYDSDKTNHIPYELTLESNPIIKDMPTISREELQFMEEALREVRAHTGE